MGVCKNCGKELKLSEKFCVDCGTENEEYTENAKVVDNKQENNNKNGKNKKGIIIAILITILIIIIATVGVLVVKHNQEEDNDSSSRKTSSSGVNLKRIYEKLDDSYYLTLASDNSCLEVDTNPLDLDDFSSTEAWDMVEEINKELELPESLNKKMESTRAMDGRQSETYGKVTVSWTYHPDKGLEVMYEKK